MKLSTISTWFVGFSFCILLVSADFANAQGPPPPLPGQLVADFESLLGYVLTPPSTTYGAGGLVSDFDDGDTATIKTEFSVENENTTDSKTFYYKIEKEEGGTTTTIATSSNITLSPGATTTFTEHRSWLDVQDTFTIKYTIVEVGVGGGDVDSRSILFIEGL